jgi:hypothetical protein
MSAARQLAELHDEFWPWRNRTQPDSGDDVPRAERPAGWISDWSAAGVAARRAQLAEFRQRCDALDLGREPVAVQVDGRLLRSALARVHWELDLLRGWERDPCFYIDQSLVPVYNLLLAPPPLDDERASAIVRHLGNVPAVLEHAQDNLRGHLVGPFARYALRLLEPAADQLQEAMAALAPLLPEPHASALPEVTTQAARCLTAFRHWLAQQDDTGQTAVGEQALAFFLHAVALLPYTPQQMRAMAAQEHRRSVMTEAIERRRGPAAANPDSEELDIVAHQRAQELEVRAFYAEQGIVRLPGDLRHYRFAVMPAYLAPLTWLGVSHYIGSPARADEDAVCYVRPPEPGLPYFDQAKLLDPRTGIVHEGVHAHQMAWSWRHPDPAHRHFYDSVPNEGLAFYNEEVALLAGLFAGAPASAAFMANSMRLRALRVEADLGLAMGDLTIDQAAAFLIDAVPLDEQTAWDEAVFFAANPGQGLSYQIGKLQILDLLSAYEGERESFGLPEFHERLWRDGNIQLALQRWEMLGKRDHLEQADSLATGADLQSRR